MRIRDHVREKEKLRNKLEMRKIFEQMKYKDIQEKCINGQIHKLKQDEYISTLDKAVKLKELEQKFENLKPRADSTRSKFTTDKKYSQNATIHSTAPRSITPQSSYQMDFGSTHIDNKFNNKSLTNCKSIYIYIYIYI